MSLAGSVQDALSALNWPQLLTIAVFFGLLAFKWFLRLIQAHPKCPTIPHEPIDHWYAAGDELNKSIAKHGSTLQYQEMMFQKHGPISEIVLPFGLNIVLVEDPAAIKELQLSLTPAKVDRDQLNAGPAFRNILPTGSVGLPTNDLWKAHRKAFAPVLSKAYLSRMVPRIASGVMELVELMEVKRKLSGDRPFDALRDVVLSMSDVAASFIFGHNLGEIRSSIDTLKRRDAASFGAGTHGGATGLEVKPGQLFLAIEEILAAMGRGILKSQGQPYLYDLLYDRWKPKRRWAIKYGRNFLRDRIEKARRDVRERAKPEDEQGDCVTAMLAEKEDTPQGLKIGTDEIIDELLTLMSAGAETSAFTLAWGLKLLARHPEQQKKLHDYLVKHLPPLDARLPTAEDLDTDKVPYLEAAVYELIRLSGSNVASARYAREDIVLLGHAIPKNTLILMSNTHAYLETAPAGYDAAQDAEARKTRGCGFWTTDPSRFEPERWIDADGKFDGRAGPFPVFGGGIRGCWGRSIALLQLKTYVALLSMHFFFANVGELDTNKAVSNISVSPESCWVKPVPWSEVAL